MGKQTLETLTTKVIAALEHEDHTVPGLQKATGLSEDHCIRALNYLKSKGRIENRDGLLHLRPAESEAKPEAVESTEPPPATELVSGQFDQITYINLSKIRRDGGTQSRAQLDPETVERYIEEMARGDQFPPIELVYDGTDYWPWDGFHRLEATERVGQDTIIAATVRQGTRRDAILLAAGANAKHGLLRSEADRHRAIETLLADEEWSLWSDRKIAAATNTYHGLVGQIRKDMFPDAPGERQVERGGQTYTMQIGAINADRPYAVTDEDRAALRLVLADGPVHKTQLERRTLIQTRAFAATLKAMQDAGEVLREGMMYQLPELPETTKTSEDAERIYQYVLADGGEKGTIGAAHVCNMLNIEPTAFTRAVNLLEADGRISRTRPAGGVTLLAAIVPPSPVEEESTPEPESEISLAYRESILRELAQEPMNYHRLFKRITGIGPVITPEHARIEWLFRATLSSLNAEHQVQHTGEPDHLWALCDTEPESTPGHDNITWDGTAFVDAIDKRAWHTPEGQRLVWVGRVETDKHYPWRATITWRNPETDDDVMFSAPGASRLDAFRAARHLAERTISLAAQPAPPFLKKAEAANEVLIAAVQQKIDAEDSAIAEAARVLSYAQGTMLCDALKNRPVDHNGTTRKALINAGLLKDYDDRHSLVGDRWEHIELTEKGREIAAYLLEQASFAVPFGTPAVDAEDSADSTPAQESDELPMRPGKAEQPLTREAILAQVANCTAASLKQNWKGLEFNETPLHQQLANEGLIAPVYKWSSGSQWFVGYVLASAADADPTIDFETALIAALSAMNRTLDRPAPDWSTVDAERRDTLTQLLRQASDAASQLLARVEETWWPPEVSAEAAHDAA